MCTIKSKGVIPLTCWAFKLILKALTFKFNNIKLSSFASHMKSSFPLCSFNRCCTVIRYSRVRLILWVLILIEKCHWKHKHYISWLCFARFIWLMSPSRLWLDSRDEIRATGDLPLFSRMTFPISFQLKKFEFCEFFHI